MKKIKQFLLAFLLAIVSFFVFGSTTFAQSTTAELSDGLESCFQYYDYGEVEVNLAPQKTIYKPGETAQIIGTVVNQNSFPLVNVVIYAQLRRVNTGDVLSEGHHLLERKQITAPMNLLAGETRFVKAEIPLLNTYPNGSYQLQTFVVSLNNFNYAGRPFLEEDFAGTSFLEITGSTAPLVYFNPSSILVNQSPHAIRGAVSVFSDEVLNFSAQLVDNRAAKKTVPVTVKFYAFDETFEESLVEEQKTTTQNGKVEVQFRPPSAGAYVMVMRIDSPTVSEVKFRFAQSSGPSPKLRVNDLGVTAYPPKSDDKAYVCIYSPSPTNTVPTSVQLEVLDKDKKVIGKNSITTEFPPDVVAISVPLGEIKDNKDFWVRSTIRVQDEPGESIIESHYSCEGFGSSPQELSSSFNWGSLSIEAINSCGQKIEQGGYIESVRVKNKNGELVKELYNLDQIKQSIDLKNLPKGEYIAEVKSGKLSKNYPFSVAGISMMNNSWVLLVVILIVLLVGASVFYYKRRKRQLVDTVSKDTPMPTVSDPEDLKPKV